MKMEVLARNRFWWGLLLLALFFTGALVATHSSVKSYFLLELEDSGKNQLDLNVLALREKLNQYRTIPAILARHPVTRRAISYPGIASTVDEAVNLYRETRNLTGASEIYLLNAEATTIAASNNGESDSFMGKNYAYRPYYKEAMVGKLGRYFGKGTASRLRGYYFSTAVRIDGRVAGVLVVKVDIDELEATLREGDFRDTGTSVLVTDRKGVVFMSNRSEWVFRSLEPLSLSDKSAITSSRQYPGVDIEPMPFRSRLVNTDGLNVVRMPSRGKGPVLIKPHILLSKDMPDVGWDVSILVPTRYAAAQADLITTLSGLLLILLILIVRSTLGKRREMRDKIAAQQQARLQLQKFASELEHRVEERTQELKQTQNELVQAAKLAALGQMSAGLSHELNQPLTAIKAYAENAVKLLDRGKPEPAARNLEVISDLISRMADIIRHLKTFARESSGKLAPVDLNRVIDDTLRFMGARLDREKISLQYAPPKGPVMIEADPQRLEQVLVNLIGNAMDAMRDGPDKYLTIRAVIEEGQARLYVSDSGSGISAEPPDRIFDPFFTTKEVGEGLGLGLSISYNIIKDFNGILSVINKPSGGAEFCISVPLIKKNEK